MSSLAILATTSEVEEELNNLKMLVSAHHSSEDSDLSGEEYWDVLDDYDVRLPRAHYELKHGKLIHRRGSNQEKFISSRPKVLVRYDKQLFTSSVDDIDEQAKDIIREFVECYHSHSIVDINAFIHSGERSVLVHVPARLNENTGEREGEEFLIKAYKQQYGVDRGHELLMKAYFNAFDMRKYANVPNVYCPTRNVGEMNFIGDYGVPAPNLNEVQFEITDQIYSDVVSTVHKLYNDGRMVHGKLSARTILWWRDKLWFISVSHAVPTSSPNALKMLMKDCCHITHFFKSKGLLKIKSIMNLFKHITGLEKIDDDVLHVLKNTRKPVKHKQKRKQP